MLIFPDFPPSLSHPVTNSLVYVAAWKYSSSAHSQDSRQRYLLGLHRVHYCSLLRFLINEEVHVVVSERWKYLHLHVGLCDRL